MRKYMVFLMILMMAIIFLFLHDSNSEFFRERYQNDRRVGDFKQPVRNVMPWEVR